MKTGRASDTATLAAAFRAAGARGLAGPVPNEDVLAERLLPLRWRAVLGLPLARGVARAIVERRFPGVLAWHNARTRTLDAWVRAELAHMPRPARLAVIAAGFDTRAQRLVPDGDDVEVIELDHPATQAVKRARLAAIGIHARARFVAVDLTQDDPIAGWADATPTCVLFEGVSMYLPRARLAALWGACGRLARGSSVLLDVLEPDVLARPEAWTGARAQIDAVARRGEPYVTGLSRDDVRALVEAGGLRVEEDVAARDLDPAACPFFRLVRARV